MVTKQAQWDSIRIVWTLEGPCFVLYYKLHCKHCGSKHCARA